MKKLLFITALTFIGLSANAQWKQSGLGSMQVSCLAVSGSNIFAGTQEDGIYLSTDNGNSWTLLNSSINTWSLAISGSNIFAGTQNTGVYVSTDNGNSWNTGSDSNSTGLPNNTVKSLVIKGDTILAGTYGGDGVYFSTNNGGNWTAIGTGLTYTYVFSVAVHGNNIFAGTAGEGLFLTTNNGSTWNAVNNGFSSTATVYVMATKGDTIFAGGDMGLYFTTNNGNSWTPVNILTNYDVKSISIKGSNIIIGTIEGAYLSTDNGASWADVHYGLPSRYTEYESVAFDGSYIFAGINNGDDPMDSSGVWKTSFFTVNTSQTNVPCYNGNNGTASVNTISGGTPPYTNSWNTVPPQTTNTATVLVAGTYLDTIRDAMGLSYILSFTIAQPSPPPTKQMCYVGFDTVTLKNDVYFPTDITAIVDSFNVYKEVSLNVWDKIGSGKAGSGYFTDMNCDPAAQSYSYEISVVDTCHNEGAKSALQTTITLLATYDSGTQTYGFSWSAYVGLTVSNYYIYGVTASGASTQIGSVLGNQTFYNYVNPNPAYVKYFVGFTAPACNLAKSSSLVKSNYVQKMTGIEENVEINNLVSVYPNPATDNLQIQTTLQIKEIAITDITGRTIYTTIAKTINCSSFAKGVYFITLTTENGKAVKKFVKE
jgi:hypothetical protein